MKISDEFLKACGIGEKRHSGFYEPQESTEEERHSGFYEPHIDPEGYRSFMVDNTESGYIVYIWDPEIGKHVRRWVEEDPESDE